MSRESLNRLNRNDLLTASSAFLDVAQGGDSALPLARAMATRAVEWAVMDTPALLDKLLCAALPCSAQQHRRGLCLGVGAN